MMLSFKRFNEKSASEKVHYEADHKSTLFNNSCEIIAS